MDIVDPDPSSKGEENEKSVIGRFG
jgi:hypothetical protein